MRTFVLLSTLSLSYAAWAQKPATLDRARIERLAGAAGTWDEKKTSGGKGVVPRADIDPAKTTLDGSKLDAAFGQTGKLEGGVYKVVVGRTVKMHGHDVGKAMGVNTWAALAGTPDQAVVDGDFAVLESELQPVLKALRAAGIYIVAIHNHMTGEAPRMMFLHYWGVGPAETLVRGFKAALAKTGT